MEILAYASNPDSTHDLVNGTPEMPSPNYTEVSSSPSHAASRPQSHFGIGRWSSTRKVVLITLLAGFVRLFRLGAKSFSPDEAFSIIFAQTRWQDFLHLLFTSEANMGLYYALLRLWSQVSDRPYFVRTLSVLFGVLAVVPVYFVGKFLFSKKVGILAATLLALSSFHVEYSMQARSYSLLVFLVTCSSLVFVRNIQSQAKEHWGWYILSSTAALYTHFFAVLVILAHFVSWLLLPPEYRKWRQLGNMATVAILGSPLLLFVLFHTGAHLDWVERLRAKEIYQLLTSLSGNGVRFIIFVFATGFAVREFLRREHPDDCIRAWSFIFVASWLVLPILVTVAVSQWKPIFVPRFLIICLVPALLLYVEGLTLISPKKLQDGVVLVVICGSLIALRSYYRNPDPTDWRAAIAFLATDARSGDVLVFANPYCVFPFDYNLRTSGLQLPKVGTITGDDDANIAGLTDENSHIWVIDFGSESRQTSHISSFDSEHFDSGAGFALQRKLLFPGVEVHEFVRDRQETSP
jgi:4-amino-4-deoxy-L-arabinose transferase-like glycosyltransferase